MWSNTPILHEPFRPSPEIFHSNRHTLSRGHPCIGTSSEDSKTPTDGGPTWWKELGSLLECEQEMKPMHPWTSRVDQSCAFHCLTDTGMHHLGPSFPYLWPQGRLMVLGNLWFGWNCEGSDAFHCSEIRTCLLISPTLLLACILLSAIPSSFLGWDAGEIIKDYKLGLLASLEPTAITHLLEPECL